MTTDQLIRKAEQTASAQLLHERACKTIPGRTVIVSADIDGRGRVEIVAMPGVVNGEGGTADILAAALRRLGGYTVTKRPMPQEIESLDSDAQALFFRVEAGLGLADR